MSPLGRVRLLLLDFDGVLTDNRVIVSELGLESVVCHRGDGWGIARLIEHGVRVVIVTSETNRVVYVRARKLGCELVETTDKRTAAERLMSEHGIHRMFTAFVGNDLPDLPAMEVVDYPIAVADAHPRVLSLARFITSSRGGYGAVREVAESITEVLPPTKAEAFLKEHPTEAARRTIARLDLRPEVER